MREVASFLWKANRWNEATRSEIEAARSGARLAECPVDARDGGLTEDADFFQLLVLIFGRGHGWLSSS